MVSLKKLRELQEDDRGQAERV